MKRLLLRLALLLLAPATFLITFEILGARAYPTQHTAKKAYLEARLGSIETLILGGSNAYFGLHPEEWTPGKGFNLAGTSQPLYYDAALLEKYIDRLTALKTVIVTVPYFALGRRLDTEAEAWRVYSYFHTYGLPHRNPRSTWHARNYSWYLLHGRPSLGRAVQMLRSDARLGMDSAGGLRPSHYPVPELGMAEMAIATLERHNRVMKFEYFPENISYLHRIETMARTKGARLILLTLPTTEDYRHGADSLMKHKWQQAVHAFSKATGASHLDFWEDPRFDDGDFYDPDHMNLNGAKKFSRMLRDYL